jgi:regulatory protein
MLKGFKEDDITTALDAYFQDHQITPADLDLRAALKLAKKKKLGPYAAPGIDTDRNKALAAFARAGFSFDLAKKILAMDRVE